MLPVDEVTKAVDDRRVAEWLGEQGIGVVHLGLFDSSGVLREKRLSPPAAARALEDGWRFIDAIDWWGPDDRVWRVGGSTDQPATVDPASGRPYPFEPDAALFIADFTGPLAELSPRALVARMVDRCWAVGLAAEVGWEFECIVLDGSDPAVLEAPRAVMPANRCWSARTPATESASLRALDDVLAAGSVVLDHCCAELGPGCLELATAPVDATRSADDAALLKLYTKAFFDRQDRTATFMAQLSEDFPGLGGHATLIFRSVEDGRLLGDDPDGSLDHRLSAAIAGVVALLPELFPMVAATPNAYRRFAPGNWAPASASWGNGNYSCALRVVRGGGSVRLELRAPGADTSPHLCLAMLLGAAVWGLEQGLVPPPPVEPPADGRLAEGAVRFPRTLAEAVDRFEVSEAAVELFGASFVSHHAGACRAEDEACRRLVPAGERTRYLLQA